MKVSKFYFPLLAAGMLASCSSENDPVIDNGNSNGEARYLAVNICNPVLSTRADVNTVKGYDYTDGDENESAVNNALFVLAKQDGTIVSAVTKQKNELGNAGKDNSETVEYISNAVIIVNEAETRNEYYQLVAIVNYTDDIKNLVLSSDGESVKPNTNITSLIEAVGNYGSENGFIMTNSVWSGSGRSTVVSKDLFQHSGDEALKTPVDVYVERVVAKVSTSAIKKNSGASQTLGTADTDTELGIDIKGIGLSFTAKESNLVKNLSNHSDWSWNWSDPSLHRSYWADNTSEELNVSSWNGIGTSGNTAIAGKYIQENTLGKWVEGENNEKTSTYVMVKATLQQNGVDIDGLVGLDGFYYTKNDGLVAVANKAFRDSEVKTSTGEQLSAEDLEFVTKRDEVTTGNSTAKAYQTFAKLSAKGETSVGADKVTEANEALSKILVKYWNGGMCYYFTQIRQNETPELYGVVRNHVYDLSLDNIGGLGTPVVDPTDPIIPEIPDDDPTKWWLAASLRVLQWRIVPTQNVDFSKH